MAGIINSDMEQMRERFAKLLLGEDMSGGGKGVSSALALSNAFTNLAGKLTFCLFSISYSGETIGHGTKKEFLIVVILLKLQLLFMGSKNAWNQCRQKGKQNGKKKLIGFYQSRITLLKWFLHNKSPRMVQVWR